MQERNREQTGWLLRSQGEKDESVSGQLEQDMSLLKQDLERLRERVR